MSGWVSSTGWNINLAAPGPIGNATPSSGAFTTLNASSNVTLSGGTANGVVYLDGSKNAASGSALTFDGTNLGVNCTPVPYAAGDRVLQINGGANPSEIRLTNNTASTNGALFQQAGNDLYIWNIANSFISFGTNAIEQMRLTSTGLQITNIVSTGGYTVATLPTGIPTGSRAYVTDALTPTSLTAVVGGGAVVVPVFYNGSAWIVG